MSRLIPSTLLLAGDVDAFITSRCILDFCNKAKMAMSSVTDVRKEDYQKEDELSVSWQTILFETSSVGLFGHRKCIQCSHLVMCE